MKKEMKAAQQEEGEACVQVWHSDVSCHEEWKAIGWNKENSIGSKVRGREKK
jgi:hypothetical protein